MWMELVTDSKNTTFSETSPFRKAVTAIYPPTTLIHVCIIEIQGALLYEISKRFEFVLSSVDKLEDILKKIYEELT